jgi:hypothetical protein
METVKHIQHLISIRDRLAKVGEAVGALLEPGEVGDDVGGALLDAAELGGEEDGLVLAVLQEQSADGVPQLSGGGVALMNQPKDLGTHPIVEPGDDVGIILEPLWWRHARWMVDVVVDAGLGERDLEQSAPLGVVGRIQREDECDMLVDEDARERRRKWSRRRRC